MQYTVKEVGNFANSTELEAAYYDSPHLEVRAGIIHALMRDGNGYNLNQFPLKWFNEFLLRVCQECVGEARELEALNHATPHPSPEVSPDEHIRVAKQKNAWMSKERQLCAIASKSILAPIASYIATRESMWGGGVTEADKNAEVVLSLISRWESTPYLALGAEPLKRRIGKFLEVYYQQWPEGKKLPDMWYRAVIHSRIFELFSGRPWQKVREHLIEYLKVSAIRDGVSFWGKLTISHFGEHAGYSTPVVKYLIHCMCVNHELDPLVDLGIVRN